MMVELSWSKKSGFGLPDKSILQDRLREYAKKYYSPPYENLFWEAADELDRLTAANKELAGEVEKLRADIKAINPAIKCRSGCHVVKEWFGEGS